MKLERFAGHHDAREALAPSIAGVTAIMLIESLILLILYRPRAQTANRRAPDDACRGKVLLISSRREPQGYGCFVQPSCCIQPVIICLVSGSGRQVLSGESSLEVMRSDRCNVSRLSSMTILTIAASNPPPPHASLAHPEKD